MKLESKSFKRISEETPKFESKKCLLSTKLSNQFYDKPCIELAKALLGKVLVRKIDENTIVKGRIVETESYLGGEDKASHSYNGRRTERNEPMYMKPGTAYVYMTYGMYFCFNVSSQEAGSAVLLRSLEPVDGLEYMIQEREKKKKGVRIKELCNGPSKLCMSLNITKETCNKIDLCESDSLWVENEEDNKDIEIVTSSRIGIQSTGDEWANKPLRFYILGCDSVSKRDKVVEKIILERLEVT